jgi:diaminopimelate epimerase
VATALAGLTGRRAEVAFPGGVLEVAWEEEGPVLLTGPAVCVFDGELDEEWVAGALGEARP